MANDHSCPASLEQSCTPPNTGTRNLPAFRVACNVPSAGAYEHVSILLGYINHLVEQGDFEDDHKLLGGKRPVNSG